MICSIDRLDIIQEEGINMKCKCATCPSHACYTKGVNCTGVPHEEVKAAYTDEELKLMQAAAYVEGTFYSNICRLQETAEFAKAMGYKMLGMAFCIGLNAEARYIAKYFEQQGFEFFSVCCKNCSIRITFAILTDPAGSVKYFLLTIYFLSLPALSDTIPDVPYAFCCFLLYMLCICKKYRICSLSFRA